MDIPKVTSPRSSRTAKVSNVVPSEVSEVVENDEPSEVTLPTPTKVTTPVRVKTPVAKPTPKAAKTPVATRTPKTKGKPVSDNKVKTPPTKAAKSVVKESPAKPAASPRSTVQDSPPKAHEPAFFGFEQDDVDFMLQLKDNLQNVVEDVDNMSVRYRIVCINFEYFDVSTDMFLVLF